MNFFTPLERIKEPEFNELIKIGYKIQKDRVVQQLKCSRYKNDPKKVRRLTKKR